MIWVLIFLVIVLWAVEKYSLRYALDRLTLETSLDKTIAEQGEEFTWTLTVKNGKRTMVPYLKIKEQVPVGLVFADNGEAVEQKGVSGLNSVLYLSGRQQVDLVRKVRLTSRGRHFFRGTTVEAGDFLGIDTAVNMYSEMEEIVVKPKPCDSLTLKQMLGGYLGDYAVKNSLFEDPVLTIGFREYTGREPFRAISWTQSAKYNKMLVKQQEPMADLSCTVLLDVECKVNVNVSARLEACFSIVRSLCEALEKERVSYDFHTNGIIAGAMGNWKHVNEGFGVGHLETMLEGLGRMTYNCRETTEELFARVLKGVRGGRSFLVVAAERTEETEGFVARLEQKSGRKVLFITADDVMREDGAEGGDVTVGRDVPAGGDALAGKDGGSGAANSDSHRGKEGA